MTMQRIAIVEDSPDNRLLLHAMLKDLFDVVEFDNGEAALGGLADARPDLVLMDISLPVMDGTQVLSRMRDDPALRDVPVIALTAHAMRGDREKYLAFGFDEYVTKPVVDETHLLEPIERLLAARASGPAVEP